MYHDAREPQDWRIMVQPDLAADGRALGQIIDCIADK
jgi:hypothetical protein